MISAKQVIRRAELDGVDAQAVERDYILAHVASQLHHAIMPGAGRLVFKGGTALRLVHAPNYWYSADLDFTVLDGAADAAITALGKVIAAARAHADLPILELQRRTPEPPLLSYIGPLKSARPRTIKVDFACNEYVETVVEATVLPDIWPDLPETVPFDVYPLEEVAAEKLRCVIQRALVRDLYDLFQLTQYLQVDLAEVATLFEMKTRARGLDPALFPQRLDDRINRLRDRWDADMSDLVTDPPHFDEVVRVLRRKLRTAGLA